MSDSEQTDEPPAAEPPSFTRRAGIVVGMVTATALVALLVVQSITFLFLLFAGILWAVFLRGTGRLLGRWIPLSIRWLVAIVLVLVLVIGGGAGSLAAPDVVEEYKRVIDMLPRAMETLRGWLHTSSIGAALPELPKADTLFGEGRRAWSNLTGVFAGALGTVGNTILILAVGVYLALDPELYQRGVVRLFPLDYRGRAREIFGEMGAQLGRWLASRLLAMFGVAVVTTAGLWLLGIPLAVPLGTLTGLLSFVPVIGPVVATVPAALLGLLKGPIYAVYVILFYGGVQALENYVLTPILSQKVVDLPPALIILVQVLLGLLTGFLGVLLATPLLVVVLVFIEQVYVRDILGEPEGASPLEDGGE